MKTPQAQEQDEDGAALEVDGLSINGIPSEAAIIEEIELRLEPGHILGVVGESGSGKTTLGLGLLRYCRRGTRLAAGQVRLGDHDLGGMSERQVRRLRGTAVAYVPQSPAAALNPALRIGTQLREALPAGAKDGQARTLEVLSEVALPDTLDFLRRYPHQLSGGQQQRVAIAMAFIARPRLIVLDEPTTGLDVTTQKHVLETVRSLCTSYSTAAVYISHDMAVVANLVDRLAVMYSGRLVEVGDAAEIFARPQHPYTTRLLMAVPDLAGRRQLRGIPGFAPSPLHRPSGCAFAPRCALRTDECEVAMPELTLVGGEHLVRCLHAGQSRVELVDRVDPVQQADAAPVLEIAGFAAGYGKAAVLEDIDLTVQKGQCAALLGESGSGKTTLSRSIAGLHSQWTGEVRLGGEPLAPTSQRRTREQRRRIQYVFQNPYDSLNPTKSVHELIAAPVHHLCPKGTDLAARVRDSLQQAALRPDIGDRYPDQLSGGERQRVAIARALAVQPDLLVCDEVTSALDVSVQSSIVELLQHLQATLGLTLLFVTHDIALVRNVAQQVAVLQHGRIVEYGAVERVFALPEHDYTTSLMTDTPAFELSAGVERG